MVTAFRELFEKIKYESKVIKHPSVELTSKDNRTGVYTIKNVLKSKPGNYKIITPLNYTFKIESIVP